MSSDVSGIRPTNDQATELEAILRQFSSCGIRQIRLAWLPDWRDRMACSTEEIVGMIEYLVESDSPLIRDFSLDMHLVDAVIQCRTRRDGTYDRSAWA